GRGIFAAALLGALGFGTSQALASPAEGAAAKRSCFTECYNYCLARYGEGVQYQCVRTTTAQYVCQCYP
ncbi:MAG TPA: hypothetical protein VGV85_00975, partial [Longimicrobiaceae bacterium]|nr:hypothetical protein [Longimicrobiaceae bacterium]